MKGSLHHILLAIACGLVVTVSVGACSGSNAEGDSEYERDTAYISVLIPDKETEIVSGPVDSTVHSLPVHVPPGYLATIFRDTNDLQLTAARAVGFEPLHGITGAYDTRHNVVKITTCDDYLVADLSYSMPYLIPRAARLLHDIGRAFRDTIKARGGKEYRIKVTSLMRTSYSVSRLKRRNRAATDSSCHLYGTTFDISWTNFDCRDSSYIVSLEDLKNILAEIVYDKREQGRCYAIYERKRGCFHITTR